MSDNVKIQIDLQSGSVLIEAPADSLDRIFDRLALFIPAIAESHKAGADEQENQEAPTSHDDRHVEQKPKAPSKPKATRKRAETYKPVELGLSGEQRQAFKEFCAEKKPSSQNDQALVIMYWLSKEAGKESLTREEIYTGFRTTGLRVPGRISSVLSNLMLEGAVISEGGTYRLHHTGEDRVTYDLPTKSK